MGKQAVQQLRESLLLRHISSGVSALIGAGIRPPDAPRWSHEFVRAQFNGQLTHRRKLYPTELREVFEQTYTLRAVADYSNVTVSEIQLARAMRRAAMFVETVEKEASK